MRETIKLTLRLPVQLHERLKQRSQAEDQSLNTVIVETLWQGVTRDTVYPRTDRDLALRVMRESGLWDPLGPEWKEEIAKAPKISHAELREQLKGMPPLSEAIIEDREPR
jgi:hypothetical protein